MSFHLIYDRFHWSFFMIQYGYDLLSVSQSLAYHIELSLFLLLYLLVLFYDHLFLIVWSFQALELPGQGFMLILCVI